MGKGHSELFFVALIILASALWGTAGTTQSFAPEGATPLSIAAIRIAIGGSALLAIALLKKAIINKKLILNKRTILAAIVMSTYQICFFAAVLKTGVAMGTVVTIGSAPIFTGILSTIINKEKPEKKWLVSTTISIIGVILLVSGGQALSIELTGIFLALGAGLSYATYTTSSKGLLKTYSPESVTGVIFFISALLLSPFLFIYDLSWLNSFQGLGVALHLGLMTITLAFTLFTYGLSKINLNKAVTLTLAEPLTASLLGIFILKETLTPISLLGIILVFAGLLTLSLKNPFIKNKIINQQISL